jgi:hypothetical protein
VKNKYAEDYSEGEYEGDLSALKRGKNNKMTEI